MLEISHNKFKPEKILPMFCERHLNKENTEGKFAFKTNAGGYLKFPGYSSGRRISWKGRCEITPCNLAYKLKNVDRYYTLKEIPNNPWNGD